MQIGPFRTVKARAPPPYVRSLERAPPPAPGRKSRRGKAQRSRCHEPAGAASALAAAVKVPPPAKASRRFQPERRQPPNLDLNRPRWRKARQRLSVRAL